MTPERWQQVKAIFDRAVECDPAAREDVIREQCGRDEELLRQVEALLASDRETTSLLDHPVMAALVSEGAAAAATAAAVDPMIGRSIGPYRVIREIGRGGMGCVYLAQRADDQFRRRVALKAVNPALVDSHTLHRFENERQTLASLDHPNIIKLIDGGTTEDGLPWLVMDYVEGEVIDRYCATHKLSIAERLRLFRTVCGAVHYAHQNLVIHRDLKPGNVLVTPEGVPKLLDFGIAKLLRPKFSFHTVGHTRTDLQPMTPHFASPEQIRGLPVTTSSDIYSLGVLLYCLVTGRHPYQLKTNSLLELERAICETDPEKPSTTIKESRLDGPNGAKPREEGAGEDLDMIVLKAMRKEPQRRYASAEHFSEDVRRLLEGRPVMARKDTWGYRFSKLVSRHKPGTAVAAAAVVALLVTGLFADREYLQARRRSAELRQFTQIVLNVDEGSQSSRTETRANLLARAVESLDHLSGEAKGDADLQLDLVRAYVNMADVQGNLYTANLGNTAVAEGMYRKALAIAEDLQRTDSKNPAGNLVEVARCNRKLGDILLARGDRAGALKKYESARPAVENLLSVSPSNRDALGNLMTLLSNIANVQLMLGDTGGAADTYERCVDTARKLAALDPSQRTSLTQASVQAAYFEVLAGRGSNAEQTIREAIDIFIQAGGANPSPTARRKIAMAYRTLARVQESKGKIQDAVTSSRESMAGIETLLSHDPKNTQYQTDFHQGLQFDIELDLLAGRKVEAHRQIERALAFLSPLVRSPTASSNPLFDYSWILVHTPFPEQQNPAAAVESAARAVTLTHESDPEILEILGLAYVKAGKRTQAIETLQKALSLIPSPKPGAPAPDLRGTIEGDLANLRQ